MVMSLIILIRNASICCSLLLLEQHFRAAGSRTNA